MHENRNDERLVACQFACRGCGERRMDALVWDEDGEKVTCATCGTTYTP